MTKHRKTSPRKRPRTGNRRRRAAAFFLAVPLTLALLAYGFVHLPPPTRDDIRRHLGHTIANTLTRTGYTIADFTDALGLTGRDQAILRHAFAGKPLPSYAGNPVPVSAPSPLVLTNDGFTVGYSRQDMVPLWVTYRVFRIPDLTPLPRPNRFKSDARTARRVGHKWYSHSGYDRGHMAPNYAISTRYGKEAQHQTFLMTNIAPQNPRLNQHVWRLLEHHVAEHYGQYLEDVWVITGPIFTGPPTHLPSGVRVPDAFYKIIVDESGKRLRVMSFVMPQEPGYNQKPARFLTSVDAVEELTGFDFFSGLPDNLEDALEAGTPTRMWPWIPGWIRDTPANIRRYADHLQAMSQPQKQ